MNLSRDDAMQDSVARGLDSATGIWFSGGDQNRTMAVLQHTPVAAAVRSRYVGGAVVGGTSAGAAVMTTPLITGEERRPAGGRPDTSQNWLTIAADNVVTADGLGTPRGSAVLGARDVRVHVLPPGSRFNPRSGRAGLPGGDGSRALPMSE